MSTAAGITIVSFSPPLLDAVWQLRLRALHGHPEAFGEPWASARQNSRSDVIALAETFWSGGDNNLFVAVNANGEPIGMLGVGREARPRERHRTFIWGVYVEPAYRGTGVSSRLLNAGIAYARSLDGVLQIHLTVESGNQRAMKTYRNAGFLTWGTMPRADILNGKALDHDLMVLMLDQPAEFTPERDSMPITARPIPTPDQFATATWADVQPLYQELVDQPLDPANTAAIEAWLHDWNALAVALGEAASLANVNYSCNTTDPELEAANLRFTAEIRPQAEEYTVMLQRKLLDTGYTRPDLETTLRRFRTDQDLFRAENIPFEQDLQKLNAEYNRTTGGMKVTWQGTDIPLPRLNPFMLSPERDTREAAWRLQFEPYIEQRDSIATIFDEQLEKRQQLARNAGFDNYRDYTFQAKYRFDYTPEDCASFQDAVAETFVPAVTRRFEQRRQTMGLESLRPWDLSADPQGRPPLKPYTDVNDWTSRTEAIFAQVDPVFGEYFGIMRNEDLLDLESRAGKRPGGFCTSFPYRKRPFIFMNASGVGSDVRTLLHEAGHAFHGFESSNLPFVYQRQYGSEMAEVASMSMELLAAPYLRREDGGFYDDAEYSRARIEHLEGIMELMPWVATIDAFQHWLYTDEAAQDRDVRDAKWLETWERYNPGVDWSGLETERTARWYKQLHVFLYPFYYIEYAIAQLGALQVWRNALTDQAQATADYRAALALGGSAPLPDLFGRAGGRLIFDTAGMQELVELIESTISRFEASTN